MNHGELRAKADAYFRSRLEEGMKRRRAIGPLNEQEKENATRSLELHQMPNRDFWHLVGSDNAQAELDKFFSGTGIPQEENRKHFPMILDEIRKAKIGLWEAVLEFDRSLGSYDFTAPQSAPVSASGAPAALPQGPSLSDAVEAFLSEQETTAGVTFSTIKKRRAILEVALEWFGPGRAMSAIDKRAAGEFKAALLTLPSNRMKVQRTRGMSLQEAMAVTDVPKISNGTANAYLSALKVFWTWAETHGYAEEALFADMTVGRKGHQVKDRRPFTQDALERTYEALTSRESQYYTKTSHRWATLIAMYSGARLNEVCQLQVSDIYQVGDIWVFDLNDTGAEGKRLKSSAAIRRVPVHSHLIELGLLTYRDKIAARGHERLFPDYTYSPKHGYGDKLSKWFNRTLMVKLGIKSDAHVFHGLRHTFATRLGQADVPTERIQFIVGHEREGVTHEVYMKEGYTLQQTRDAVERFKV
ncbi:site-specific integrase [Cribrihabitans marinus]|nr:site-specific integrase [Cribrihabitans marinus]